MVFKRMLQQFSTVFPKLLSKAWPTGSNLEFNVLPEDSDLRRQ